MSSKRIVLLIASGVLAVFLLRRSFTTRRKTERRDLERAAYLDAQRQTADEAARIEADRLATEEAARLEALRQAAEDLARREGERQAAEEEARLEAERLAEADAFREEEAQRRLFDETAQEPELKAKAPEQTVVMVADDSKVVRVKTGRLLAAHNYQVVMAEDGLDAVRQIENSVPDLLITDVDMPGMGGMELVRQLRHHERTVDIPIIMITADSESLRKEAAESGVNVVLGKPYPEEQLIAQIQLLMIGRTGG